MISQDAYREEILKKVDEVIARGPYKDTWESLAEYEVPAWYKKAKFGIFIHWGVYSVPAFDSEWYSRNMYIQGSKAYEHHLKTYGPHKEFGYKDFIPMFKAEKWDPREWAEIFKDTGAQYVVPVAEHHDGFQMYKSHLSHWNAAEMGPCRDVVGELSRELHGLGIETGVSTHRIEHWFFMGHGKQFDSDITDAEKRGDFYWPAMEEHAHQDSYSKPDPTEEYLEDWLARTIELIDNYQPKVLYFDWWIRHESAAPYLRKIAAYYYNRNVEWGKGGVICYKHDAYAFGTALPDMERGQFSAPQPFYWQSDTAIARNSWCYTEGNDFKSAASILCDLIDIVSKNGNLLLNVGPKADGTISDEDLAVLRTIGKWMRANGEAIYNSRPWRVAMEGSVNVAQGQFTDAKELEFSAEDFRFTSANGHLYVHALRYPENGEICVKSFALNNEHPEQQTFQGILDDVEVLGFDEKPEWELTEEGLKIRTKNVSSREPVVFRLTIR